MLPRVAYALLGGGAALGAAAAAYATRVEPHWLEIREFELPLARLPRALDGLTVLHLSDLHAKADQRWHQQLITRAAAVPADVVCLTGDYGDRPRWAHRAVDALRLARGRLGTFAVLGNHDFVMPFGRDREHHFSYEVGGRVAALLEAQGTTVLRNESARLCIEGAPLWLVGVDDPHTFYDDVWRAYRCVPPGEPSIFLTHSWEPTPIAAECGAILALAGHTHGGQVRPPFLPPPIHNCHRKPPRTAGLSRVGDTTLHISQGLGGTFELRFLVRPQAVRFTLRAASLSSPT